MRKLTLKLDELAVESFAPSPGGGGGGGTVRAHDSIQYCPTGLSYCGEHQCNTDTGVCGPATQCAQSCVPADTCAYSCGYSCGGCATEGGTCTLAYECCS
jgi:hypothetical protein